jgi:hypothetical protein
MGGHDLALVGDAEAGEDLVGMAHGLPVGLAAHDDSDERLTGITHMPETHDDARHAVSQALSGLGQFARNVRPQRAGCALRTPAHSAMFGRTNTEERCAHGYRHSVELADLLFHPQDSLDGLRPRVILIVKL